MVSADPVDGVGLEGGDDVAVCVDGDAVTALASAARLTSDEGRAENPRTRASELLEPTGVTVLIERLGLG